jgi:hypothetical protein
MFACHHVGYRRVLGDAKEDHDLMEDLSIRTSQEVLVDHLNLAENWGERWASSASSRRTSAATSQRR